MKKLLSFLMILMLSLAIVACGTSEEDTTDTTETTDTSSEIYEGEGWSSEHYNPETMEGTELSLYGVTDAVIPVLEDFESDTGIKVENLTMKNGEILQRIQNEYESGISIADIWFTGGADTFISASQDDLFIPYKSPNGEDISDDMKDKDGYWHGTSLTLINWVVNTELLEEKGLEMPKVWDDLLAPELKGEVSLSDPASSGTAYNVITAMIEVKGEDGGWEYLEKLNEQIPFYTPRGSDPAQNVINGEAIVGINPTDGDMEMELNNPHIKLVYPEDGTGWWPQPVAIINGTEKEEAAKVFIDWLLSERGMESIARNRNAAVAKPGVETPEGIIEIDDINLLATDFQVNAEKRDEILQRWQEMLDRAQ